VTLAPVRTNACVCLFCVASPLPAALLIQQCERHEEDILIFFVAAAHSLSHLPWEEEGPSETPHLIKEEESYCTFLLVATHSVLYSSLSAAFPDLALRWQSPAPPPPLYLPYQPGCAGLYRLARARCASILPRAPILADHRPRCVACGGTVNAVLAGRAGVAGRTATHQCMVDGQKASFMETGYITATRRCVGGGPC